MNRPLPHKTGEEPKTIKSDWQVDPFDQDEIKTILTNIVVQTKFTFSKQTVDLINHLLDTSQKNTSGINNQIREFLPSLIAENSEVESNTSKSNTSATVSTSPWSKFSNQTPSSQNISVDNEVERSNRMEL